MKHVRICLYSAVQTNELGAKVGENYANAMVQVSDEEVGFYRL